MLCSEGCCGPANLYRKGGDMYLRTRHTLTSDENVTEVDLCICSSL